MYGDAETRFGFCFRGWALRDVCFTTVPYILLPVLFLGRFSSEKDSVGRWMEKAMIVSVRSDGNSFGGNLPAVFGCVGGGGVQEKRLCFNGILKDIGGI